ncbi:MAG: hypothetical protein U0Q11_05615 [Vicinamibacterales bacterium]
MTLTPSAQGHRRLAADDLALDTEKAGTASRLVLIDTTELGWQPARCRAKSHRLSPADPVLVGFTTSQQWVGSDCRWCNWRIARRQRRNRTQEIGP